MASTYYVNGITGDNAWDGTSPTFVSGTTGPKRTIVGARAVTAAGDLVLIAPGVYLEPNQAWTAATDYQVLYRRDPFKPGKVIVDFENRSPSGGGNGFAYHWYLDRGWMMDIHFRNPYPGAALIASGYNDTRLVNCVLYDRDGGTNVGHGLTRYNSTNPIVILNCSFYNLNVGTYWNGGSAYNNYFVNVTAPFSSFLGGHDYNAFAGNTEAFGVNTSTGASPGFTDAPNEDFTIDSVTTPADWATFQISGLQKACIGAWGNGGFYYTPDMPQLYFFSHDPTYANGNPQPAWENDSTYADGTPGTIIPDPITGEPIIDLATTPAATGGRCMTDVIDMGSTSTLIKSISYSGFEDPINGAAFDINNTTPFAEEYRSAITSFAKGDGSPSWIAYERGDDIGVTGHRYVQLRLTLRTDHTNAAPVI